MNSKTRDILIKIDSLVPIVLAVVIALAMLFLGVGCDNEGGYELVPGNPNGTGGSGGDGGGTTLNPPGSGGGSPGTCYSVPAWWDMRTYQGCTVDPARMSGIYRGSNHLEKSFYGKNFTDTEGAHKDEEGSLFYLVKPDGEDCGPVKVAMVSSSGTVEIKVAAEVEYYMLVPELVELVWMKLHNSNPPSDADYYSAEFSSLLIDLFECEKENTSCPLKSKVSGGLPPGIVQPNGIGDNATTNGAFCGRMFIVMRSRKP